MTSVTAATARPLAPPASGKVMPGRARPASLRDATWVRATLGVAIAGLLAADLSIVLRERAEAAATGTRPAPAVRTQTAADARAVPTSRPATWFYDTVHFDSALAAALAAAPVGTPTVAAAGGSGQLSTPTASAGTTVDAPPASAPQPPVVPSARPADGPAATPPASTAPRSGSLGDAGNAVTDLVVGIPVIGPAAAPVVDSVMDEVGPVVGDAAPAGAAAMSDPAAVDTVEAVGTTETLDSSEAVTAPVTEATGGSGLLG